MGIQSSRRALLTWEDVESEGRRLDPELQDLLQEIIASQRSQSTNDQTSEGPWYISKVNIQGHVGIGETSLPIGLRPTNGVMIISGRNGTGKTSAADAIRHVLSAGQERSYKLADNNLHYAKKSIVVTVTNGRRDVEISCGTDGIVHWRDVGGTEGPVPAAWTAAFERYLPVLLYPEISPIIEQPTGLHEFLKGALELNTLDRLLDAVDARRTDGRDAIKSIRNAHELARQCASDHGDQEFARRLDELGPTPTDSDVTELCALVETLPAAVSHHIELAETWPHDGAQPERVSLAADQLRSARSDVVAGAQQVHRALDLLQDDHAYLARFRQDDVCPVCRTPGARWAAQAKAHSESLQVNLSNLTRAERGMNAELQRVRPFLPPAMPPRTREALHQLGDPDVPARLEQWDRLAATAETLTDEAILTVDVGTTLTEAADLASWYESKKETISRDDCTAIADRATLRTRIADWRDTLRAQRTRHQRGKLADKLRLKVAAWIKETRSILFDPIGNQILELWSILNPDADLELTSVNLAGGPRQAGKVALGLSAQGVPVTDSANGPLILSTGQRNALSLATYLPRATQPRSPFRFLVLDDPVHAFDGWRVGFLARHLASLGKQYQIIVFTHDDRLYRELRALGCDPTHLRLDRPPGERSHVRVTNVTRPSGHLLDDLQQTLDQEAADELGTPEARAAMALAMCRQALDTEISTQLEILGRRLGKTDDELRSDLKRAHKTRERLDLLNQYASAVHLATVDYSGHQQLLSKLNAGAHGRSPQAASRRECVNWVRQTRQLAKAIDALTGQP